MRETRYVTPQAHRWPEHWQLPTDADLKVMRDGYRRGLLPPDQQLLNQPAAEVVPDSARCLDVAERLYEVARAETRDGQRPIGGLAAPQIGVALRIVLFDTRAAGDGPPQLHDLGCVVNPTLTPVGDSWVRLPEGCASTGRITGWVHRPATVMADGFDLDGTRVRREYTGRAARVLQHEVDHLDGVRFPDRTADPDLLWVSTDQVPAFVTHVRAVLEGDQVPGWAHHTPRDQWVAIKQGAALFGGLDGPAA